MYCKDSKIKVYRKLPTFRSERVACTIYNKNNNLFKRWTKVNPKFYLKRQKQLNHFPIESYINKIKVVIITKTIWRSRFLTKYEIHWAKNDLIKH